MQDDVLLRTRNFIKRRNQQSNLSKQRKKKKKCLGIYWYVDFLEIENSELFLSKRVVDGFHFRGVAFSSCFSVWFHQSAPMMIDSALGRIGVHCVRIETIPIDVCTMHVRKVVHLFLCISIDDCSDFDA